MCPLVSKKRLHSIAYNRFPIKQNTSERKLEAKICQGLKITHRKIVEEHRRNNQPLIFSENGKVKYVDPFTVEI